MYQAKLLESLSRIVFGVVEFLIGLRIILKLFGASTSAPFVNWVYETSEPLLKPFLGMFPSPKIEGFYLLEFSAIFGLLTYGFIGYLVEEILATLTFQSSQRRKKVDRED